MKNIKLYLSLALIITAFLAGLLSGNSRDGEKELQEIREKDRAKDLRHIKTLEGEITRLQADSAAIQGKRIEDSLYFAGALERNQMALNRLKKKYNEINLSRATVHELDSVVSALYGR